jgi:hypothetical protein
MVVAEREKKDRRLTEVLCVNVDISRTEFCQPGFITGLLGGSVYRKVADGRKLN